MAVLPQEISGRVGPDLDGFVRYCGRIYGKLTYPRAGRWMHRTHIRLRESRQRQGVLRRD